MIRLWQIEWRKLRSYVVFWVMIGLYLLSLALVMLGIKGFLSESFGNVAENLPLFSFPDIWQNLTWFASYFDIILVMIVIIIVANEFSYRTARQNVIDGLSRLEFLLSKALLSAVMSIVASLIVLLLILLVAFIYGNTDHNFLDNIEFIGAFCLQLFGFLSFGVLLSVLLRRTGFAIVLFFIYYMMIEPFLVYVLPSPIENYMPLRVVGDMVVSPIPSTTNLQDRQTELVVFDVLKGLLYIGIFWVASYFLLQRKDL